MIETGVNLTLQDNASASARRVAAGFEEVAKSADGINNALDPNVLDQYNQKLTQIGESYAKLDRGMKLRDQYQAQQSRMMFAGAGSAVGSLSQGNIPGAVAGASKALGIKELISKVPGPIGIALAAAAATVGVGVIAGQSYQGRAGGAEMVAGLEGMMGTDISANTQALHEAMRSTVDAVSKYGKTYEEGTKAAETFLKAGGADFAGTSQSAAYSLARRADFNRLASFEGMTQRYGISGSLGIVDALRKSQGLGIGQFEEVMGGYQDIVSSRLGKGISGGGGEIARQLEFFSKAGVTWQGGLGAQKVQGLNQAVAGAAGLQQQSDLFLYRAAAGITGGDMIKTKMLMEKGLTGELFQGLMGEFSRIGYGETESILQLSKMFGISTTDASALYGLKGQGISGTQYEGLGGLSAREGATLNTVWKGGIEQIKQFAAEIFGKAPFETMAEGIGKIDKTANNILDAVNINKDIIATKGTVSEQYARITQSRYSAQDYNRLMATIRQDEMMDDYGSIPSLQNKINEALKSGVSRGSIYGALGLKYESMVGIDASGKIGIDPSEMSILAKLLIELITETKETTKAINGDTILEDNTGILPMSSMGYQQGRP